MHVLLVWLFVIFAGAKPDFIVLEATAQNQFGGQAAAGKGTLYKIQLIANISSKKVDFQKIWCDSIWYSAEFFNSNNKKISSFEKNDTLAFFFTKQIKTDQMGRPTAISMNVAPPVSFNGRALLVYEKKNKQKYFAIENFTQLHDQIRR